MLCPCRAFVRSASQGRGTARQGRSTVGAQHGMCEVTLAFTVLKEPHYKVRVGCSDVDVGSGRIPEAKQVCSTETATCAHADTPH